VIIGQKLFNMMILRNIFGNILTY